MIGQANNLAEKHGTAYGRITAIAALMIACLAMPVLAGTNAVFSSAYLGSGNLDASVGLNSGKTYFNAVNLHGTNLTINGVGFEASYEGNPFGSTWSISNEMSVTVGGAANNITGQLGSLVNDFIYGGSPGWVMLSNLTAGQTYILSFYNRSYEAAGSGVRVQTILSSSGASTVFDEDIGASGAGEGTILRYTFIATGLTESVMFSPNSSGTMHLYGFSTEQVFNKTWAGGSNWSGSSWVPAGAPDGVGSNVSFTAAAISAPTTITLSAATTLGHLQFEGLNAYTISGGGNTLTIQADTGGAAIIYVTNGTHFISAPVVLNSLVHKFGDGTLKISGNITGTGKGLNINAGGVVLAGSCTNLGAITNNGSLTISNSAVQVVNDAMSGAGGLVKQGEGRLVLSGPNTCNGSMTIADGTLEISNSVPVYYGAVHGSGGLVKSWAGTMFMFGTNSNTGDTLLQTGKINMGGDSVSVSNFSFEAHDVLTNGTYQYRPTGAVWTFASNSGINSNGGPFYTPVAPSGFAGGFIQGSGGGISQSIDVSTDGFYNVSFMAVGRGSSLGPNGLLVQVDGVSAGYWDESRFSQTVWQNYSARVYMTAGVHTLAFVGSNRYGGDRSTCIDNVMISEPTGLLSPDSILKIAGGTVFDPGGVTQTVRRLILDGHWQYHGTYGATGSGAMFTNDTYFAGEGVLKVLRDPEGFIFIIR